MTFIDLNALRSVSHSYLATLTIILEVHSFLLRQHYQNRMMMFLLRMSAFAMTRSISLDIFVHISLPNGTVTKCVSLQAYILGAYWFYRDQRVEDRESARMSSKVSLLIFLSPIIKVTQSSLLILVGSIYSSHHPLSQGISRR